MLFIVFYNYKIYDLCRKLGKHKGMNKIKVTKIPSLSSNHIYIRIILRHKYCTPNVSKQNSDNSLNKSCILVLYFNIIIFKVGVLLLLFLFIAQAVFSFEEK